MPILLIHFALLFITTVGQNSRVATVNGEPIAVAELKFEMSNQRTGVYTYFADKLKLGEEPLNWTKSYKGEVPIEILRQRALKNAISKKILQIQMKKYGVQNAISYKDFKNMYDNSVKQRKEALKNGKVIYGPLEYSESNFFNYTFNNHLLALKTVLDDQKIVMPSSYNSWLTYLTKGAKVIVHTEILSQIHE